MIRYGFQSFYCPCQRTNVVLMYVYYNSVWSEDALEKATCSHYSHGIDHTLQDSTTGTRLYCNQGGILLQCMTTLYTEPKEAIELRRMFFFKMMFLFVAGKVGSLELLGISANPGGGTYKHCLGPHKGDRNGAYKEACRGRGQPHSLYGVPFLYGHRHRVPKRRSPSSLLHIKI